MGKFRLQDGYVLFVGLSVTQIPDISGEIFLLGDFDFTHGKFDRKCVAIPSACGRDTARTDHALFAGFQIMADIPGVRFTIWRWHQHADILAQQLFLAKSEHLFGTLAERSDRTALIDQDHRVRDHVDERVQFV